MVKEHMVHGAWYMVHGRSNWYMMKSVRLCGTGCTSHNRTRCIAWRLPNKMLRAHHEAVPVTLSTV